MPRKFPALALTSLTSIHGGRLPELQPLAPFQRDAPTASSGPTPQPDTSNDWMRDDPWVQQRIYDLEQERDAPRGPWARCSEAKGALDYNQRNYEGWSESDRALADRAEPVLRDVERRECGRLDEINNEIDDLGGDAREPYPYVPDAPIPDDQRVEITSNEADSSGSDFG